MLICHVDGFHRKLLFVVMKNIRLVSTHLTFQTNNVTLFKSEELDAFRQKD